MWGGDGRGAEGGWERRTARRYGPGLSGRVFLRKDMRVPHLHTTAAYGACVQGFSPRFRLWGVGAEVPKSGICRAGSVPACP